MSGPRKEFESGHIAGVLNVDWNAPDFEKKVSDWTKEQDLLGALCQASAAKASDKLSA
jgi:hypothetical protein